MTRLGRAYNATRALLTLLASVAVFVFGIRHVAHFTIDDAGITYAYARHLAEGYGLVAVPGGAQVEGYSNPLWVLVLSIVHLLGFSVPDAAKVLGTWLGFSAIVFGVLALQHIEGRCWKQLRWRDVLVASLMGLCPEVLFWLPSGLENGLLAALLMGLALLDMREADHPHRLPYSAALAVAVAITRPEGFLYGAAIGGIKLLDALLRRHRWRSFLLYASTLVAGLCAYHAWHAFAFELPFPNTYYAKDPGLSADKLARGWAYFRRHTEESNAHWLIPLVAIGMFRHFRAKAPLLAIVVVATLFTCISGGDWMPFGRFFSFAFPAAVVLAACGLRDLSGAVSFFTRRFGLGPEPIATAAVLLLVLTWYQRQDVRLERIRKDGWCHYCNREADVRGILKTQAALRLPVASLLIHDFGAVSYASDETFTPMDLLGLCDHTIARSHSMLAGRPRSAQRVLYQYFLQEQDRPPTFLYFPEAWWPGLAQSTEILQGYYRLPKRFLGKNHRRDAIFAIHRSAFLDYFPAVDRFERRDLDNQLLLLGTGLEGTVRPENIITVSLAILPKNKIASPRVSVSVRLTSGGSMVESRPVPLFGDVTELLRQWEPGEPYSLEVSLALPAEFAAQVNLEVGVSKDGGLRTWYPLRTLDAGAAYSLPRRPLERFATNLPGPRERELVALSRKVSELVDQRQRRSDEGLASPDLASHLEQEARRAEERGERDQAYLAYVLAARANRRAFVRWLSPLWRLRPLASNESLSIELALLRRTYSSGDEAWTKRLARYYLTGAHDERAEYFIQRVSDPSSRPALEQLRTPTGPGLPQLDDWQDFEAPAVPPEWSVKGTGFGTVAVDLDAEPNMRGHHGRRLLSSHGGSLKHRGSVTSPPLPTGGALSFLVGGSRQGVRVDLLVDDEVVRTTAGPGSTQLTAVLWDLADIVGREARLRVIDDSPTGYIVVDRFVMWK